MTHLPEPPFACYTLAQQINPKEAGMPQKLRSRKFWVAVVGAFLIIANEGLGWNLPADTITQFAIVLISYIAAEGAVDMVRTLNR